MKLFANIQANTALAALLLMCAVQTHATPILRLTSGAQTVTIADGDANDSHPNAGVVLYTQAIGDFFVSVTTGLSKPALGSAESPWIDLNSVDVSSSAGGTLTIELTDTDFLFDGSSNLLISNIGGTTSGTVTLNTYFDDANAEFGQTGSLASFAGFGPGAFSGSMSNSFSATGSYSLTQVVTITHTGTGVTSFDAELMVPEPSALLLLGIGLLGMGTATLRRRRLLTSI